MKRITPMNLTLGTVAVVALAGIVTGLSLRPKQQAAIASVPIPAPRSVQTSASTNRATVDGIPANEMGRIPILMYHSVGERGAYDRHGLNIPPSLFRKHLQLFYDNGFYPINARDILSARLDVPKGKIPFAITFDDARGSQFRYRKDGTIDPDCAIGILESFHKKHGENWPQRATFFVLPKSQYNPIPFWQDKQDTKKFQFLANAGYELANHSTSHRAMSKLNAEQLAWETKTCRDYVKARAANATMDTLAFPYGVFPRGNLNEVLLQNGNRCLFMAWGDASYPSYDKRFDRKAVMRVGSEPGNIERWVAALVRDRKKRGNVLRPYISDGDPNIVTVPDSMMKHLDKAKLGSEVRLIVYSEPKPASKTKTGKGEKSTKPIKSQ
jgi:peptidoglycan/xylan/chitin deacetylase (PgdA/CDA1 family)